MRIAYVAPYQGPSLIRARPIVRNLGLAANLKIELISEQLQRNGHNIEVLSQGEVVERRLTWYRSFADPSPFEKEIPVYYGSAFPIKFANSVWPSVDLLRIFRRRHKAAPYDLVIIYNLQLPQILCATFAIRRLGLPVILEHEDDAWVGIDGQRKESLKAKTHVGLAGSILRSVSGCIAVSPRLLARVQRPIPKLLLRGVVSDDVLSAARTAVKNNWVVFSGTHFRTKGLEQLIKAWQMAGLKGWELHIAGHGELTAALEEMARNDRTVLFHGLLNRHDNASLLATAKIAMNPHDVSGTPGNIFAFKIIEYLAAGAHVITTPMGALEAELEAGITYIAENSPETIAEALKRVIAQRGYERTATEAAQSIYGVAGVRTSLDALLKQVMNHRCTKRSQ